MPAFKLEESLYGLLAFDPCGIRKASFWLALISMQAWLFSSLHAGINNMRLKNTRLEYILCDIIAKYTLTGYFASFYGIGIGSLLTGSTGKMLDKIGRIESKMKRYPICRNLKS